MEEAEKHLASAINFLLEGGDKDAAMLLLSAEMEEFNDRENEVLYVTLRGSRKLYDVMEGDPGNPIGNLIYSAIYAIFSSSHIIINTRVKLIDVDLDWRAKLLAEFETDVAPNQNSYQKSPLIWKGMRFSSEPEIEIAKALDRAGVMYVPNCLVRVGSPNEMVNRFPDFLICHAGKWGILEVDGQKFHTGRATEDHERSRLIERHGGIAYLTRFDYQRCMKDPDGVVKDFLEILRNK